MKRIIVIAVLLALAGCAHPGQNRYGYQDVGHANVVEFGTVVRARKVEITGQNTGVGAATGMGVGAIAGAGVGNGRGELGAMLAGAVIGGIAGHMTEQAIADHDGVEYVVTLHNGKTVTITQNLNADEEVLHRGQRVMVQLSGAYSRVLPADDLPEKIKKPKKIKVED